MVRPLIQCAAATLLLIALGLLDRDLVHCSKRDPGHPVALSNYLEARGFPFAWLTTDSGTCGDLPGVPGAILWNEFLRSGLFWLTTVVIAAWLRSRRARARNGSTQ